VDVFRFVRDATTRGLDNAILERHGMSALRRWSGKGRPYDVQIQLCLCSRGREIEYGFTLGSESRGEYSVKQEKCVIKSKQNPIQVYEIREGEWTQVPDDFGDKRLPRISSSNLALPFYPFSDLYLLLGDLKRMGFYTIYPDTLREPQKPANPNPLEEKGQNLATVLRALKRRKRPTQVILEALEKVSQGITDYAVTQVGGYLVTRLHHGEGGPAFELYQESDGTLRMLGILTALYQEPPRPLLAIEEPELTIHPGALGVLCDALKEASARSQVLITTHSPDLIYQFPAEALRVVEKVDGAALVGAVAEHQRLAITQKLFAPGELMRMEGLQRETTQTGE
jgi:predicted ATPase